MPSVEGIRVKPRRPLPPRGARGHEVRREGAVGCTRGRTTRAGPFPSESVTVSVLWAAHAAAASRGIVRLEGGLAACRALKEEQRSLEAREPGPPVLLGRPGGR